MLIFSSLLILSFNEGAEATIKAIETKVKELAEAYDAVPIKEWSAIYKMDKGLLDEAEPFEKKLLASQAYNYDLRMRQLFKPVQDFAFPLRFCIFPFFKFNYTNFCISNIKDLTERKECLNQFCNLCCGLSQEMLIDMANRYTTAKSLGLTLTPGANIIKKVITEDEQYICSRICNHEYPVKAPVIKANPPKIKYLGENENPNDKPVAWSCIDILRWDVDMSEKIKSGYYYLKISGNVFKAYCDMDNGGWTLYFNYINQGNRAVVKSEYASPGSGTDETMFPQLIKPDDRKNEFIIIPLVNTHFPLNKIMVDEMDKIPSFNKVSELWFFCSMFEVPDKVKNIVKPVTMASYTSKLKGVISTAFTNSRANMEEIWLMESGDLVPSDTKAGDEDDTDELPQFYLLHKFNAQTMKENGKLNNFRKAGKKENYKTFVSGDSQEYGFVNDFWMTTEDIEGTTKEVPEVFKWSIQTFKENDAANNGIWNCDSDFDKEKSDSLMSLHQVYFKTLNPEIEDLEKRADEYKLWPKE